MKSGCIIHAALMGVLLAAPIAALAQFMPGQSFSGSAALAGIDGVLAVSNAPDSSLYADGTRAINDDRWSDAVTIFAKVASEKGAHADGALYWKAYAENKQGQSKAALSTCSELRRDFPASSWIHECGALEIEIRAKSGQPVQPMAEQDQNLQLLAVNSLMRRDEPRALAEIQRIMQDDPSERFKEKILFILAQSKSQQARELLAQIAQGKVSTVHPSSSLQARAAILLEGYGLPGSPYPAAPQGSLTLDVVVTDKSGAPVGGLQPSDFKLFDNNQPHNIVSVQAASAMSPNADPPVEVILLIDAINPTFMTVAYERQCLASLLQENGKILALPTSIILLTDQGMKIQEHPTRNGKALLDYLNNNATGLRQIRRSEGLEGEMEREYHSLAALDYLAVQASKRPGRKLLIWLSSGWYINSTVIENLRVLPLRKIFTSITTTSTALREARITLYSIDPQGVDHDKSFYRNYLKGVDEPKHADYGDLLLEVLATQSGGQVLFGSNDLASLIDRCVMDAKTYYVLSFKPPVAAHPDEYHDLAIQIDKPGLKARTRSGYYAQP